MFCALCAESTCGRKTTCQERRTHWVVPQHSLVSLSGLPAIAPALLLYGSLRWSFKYFKYTSGVIGLGDNAGIACGIVTHSAGIDEGGTCWFLGDLSNNSALTTYVERLKQGMAFRGKATAFSRFLCFVRKEGRGLVVHVACWLLSMLVAKRGGGSLEAPL